MLKVKKRSIVTCFLFLLILFFLAGCKKEEAKNEEKKEKEYLMTLTVFSDVHIGKDNTRPEEKFESALKQLASLVPELDGIAFVGDLVDRGTDKEYEDFNRILKANLDSSIKRIYCMGNHEYFRDGVVRYGGESKAFIEECQQAYMDNTDGVLDSVHVINGIHVISVSARDSAANYRECEDFIITSVEKAVKANPNVPIIVLAHEGAGSFFEGGCNGYTQKTIDTLNKYPQIIFFSGHTHLALQDNRMIQQNKYTTVQTSTLGADFWNYSFESEYQPENSESASQGLILRVKKDGTSEITRYDFAHEAVIGGVWKVDPNNFTHIISMNKELAKDPVFPQETISVEIDSKKILVNFSAAKLEDQVTDGIVYSYHIRITDKEAGKIIHSKTFLSDYYMGIKAKESLQYEIKGLAAGDYSVRIYASSIYGRRSKSLQANFVID